MGNLGLIIWVLQFGLVRLQKRQNRATSQEKPFKIYLKENESNRPNIQMKSAGIGAKTLAYFMQ